MAKNASTKNLALALLEMTDGKTEGEIKTALKEFAEYLNKKGLLHEMDELTKHYRALYNTKHNIVEATVTLIERLSEKTRLELREALKKKYKAREVHMLEKVDARLLGGMKIQVGDEIYDSSLKNALRQLEIQLLK
jgi:F-type H+-transporting ATPase subunit delta